MNTPKKEPAVSVIMPTFNRENFIEEAIKSVLDQTFNDFELIIVDDGSTDNTKNKIDPYLGEHCFYFNIGHKANVSRLRNFGLQKAKGKYIAYLDSDDLWEKDKLMEQVRTLNANEAIGLIFTDVVEFEKDNVIRKDLYKKFDPLHKISFKDLLNNTLAIYPSSILFRTSCLICTGLHDEAFLWNDLGFITRMIAHHGAIFISKNLTRIRKHNNNVSVVLKNEAVGYRDMIKTIKQLYDERFLSYKEYISMSSRFYYSMGTMYAHLKDFKKAAEAYYNAVKLKPRFIKAWLRYLMVKVNLMFS